MSKQSIEGCSKPSPLAVVLLLRRSSGGGPCFAACCEREPTREAGGEAPMASLTLVSRACRCKRDAQVSSWQARCVCTNGCCSLPAPAACAVKLQRASVASACRTPMQSPSTLSAACYEASQSPSMPSDLEERGTLLGSHLESSDWAERQGGVTVPRSAKAAPISAHTRRTMAASRAGEPA